MKKTFFFVPYAESAIASASSYPALHQLLAMSAQRDLFVHRKGFAIILGTKTAIQIASVPRAPENSSSPRIFKERRKIES